MTESQRERRLGRERERERDSQTETGRVCVKGKREKRGNVYEGKRENEKKKVIQRKKCMNTIQPSQI